MTFIVLASLLLNCKNEHQNVNSKSIEKNEITLLDTLQLKLNNGYKWVANKETHIGIKNMDSIIKRFHNESNKNYVSLGEALSKQTSFVIKNCTMQGEPHDQLHVVLVPMLDEISTLKEEVNKGKTEKALQTLEALISDYFEYFKL